jgi:probable HAF family extracellular repeat protein
MRALGGFFHDHAFVWHDGILEDLNTLIPAGSGLTLVEATGINNAGQIVGWAYDASFRTHAFLLNPTTPVPTVTQTLVNGNTDLQRSRVTSLTITFNSVVNFANGVDNAFTLTRNGGGAVNFQASADSSGGVTVVTLNGFSGGETNFGSLRDGRFTLTALASQISNASGQLNGGTNYTFGDGQGLFRFFGDANGDRRVDIADFGLLSSTYGLNSSQTGFLSYFDFNNDGVIDIGDFGQFSIRVFTIVP